MKRILICGSREWSDPKPVAWVLAGMTARFGEITVIHGAARGADSIAAKVATHLLLPVEAYPADWNAHGKAAGPKRNEQMLATGIDYVVAFKDGFDHSLSRGGTEHMVRIARLAGVPTYIMEH